MPLAIATAAVFLASAPGCGAHGHPPALGDNGGGPGAGGGDGTGSGEGGSSLLGDGGLPVPMCNLGPQGGVCACVDQPLLGDPPNLYFVLDRSGSMSTPWSGAATGTSKWLTVLNELEHLVVALGPRASYAAAVLPSTKGDSCGAGNEVFPAWPGTPVLRGDAPAGTLGPNEEKLIAVLSAITAYGGTPSAATLSGLAPTIEAIPGKTYVIFATDGGPNCDAAAQCPVDQCTPNIENAPGCPPEGPTNCCMDPTQGGPLACLDAAPTIAAVQGLAKAGVPVYVVGVPQSEPYAVLLDELAEAGGTARSGEPKYYAASATDPSALLAALKKIAAQITGTCTLTLDNEPPDPALVNVFFDGSPIPQAGPDGWILTTTYGDAGAEAGSGDAGTEAGSGDAGTEAGSGDAGTEAGSGDAGGRTIVTVLGKSCQKILDGDVLDVRVVAGCPTVTH